jgi:NADH-quinone oxidoreductase subunit K
MNGVVESAMNVGLPHYLVLSALLFALGLATVATRRNAVAILMGVELILNAAGLNFVAFAHFVHGGLTGQLFTVFIIVMAATEAVVAMAIVLAIFRNFKTIDAGETATLRE